uniref:uncharacterized protein LOC120331544 n=1 Tax=Styela clava TaxID=7725 RepID=UPI0019393067|nr:uncharacterized protein LOC120331544 [Styela clava]
MTFNLFLAISKFASENEVKELLMDPWEEFKATKDQILELSKWKVCGKISIIDISQNPMDEKAFDTLGYLLSNYEVDQLIAKNCQLTKAKVDALGSHSGLKLSRFDISENPMDEKGFNALGSLLTANNMALDLVMQNCQLTKEKLDAFGSHSGLKINVLNVQSISRMPSDLCLTIFEFASRSGVKKFLMNSLDFSKANKEQLKKLRKYKLCGKISVIDISQNLMDEEAFDVLADLLSNYEVDQLIAKNCQLTKAKLDALGSHSGLRLDILDVSGNTNLGTADFSGAGSVVSKCQLEILDISYNKILGISGFGEVGLVVSKCQVKKFIVRGCSLTAEGIRAFKENTCNAKLDILNVSGNTNLGTSGFGEVGSVVSKCQLDILDISGNDNLDTAGWGEVGLVVSKCQVKALEANDCNLTAEGINAFKENTSNAKIDSLDLSSNKVSKLGDEGLSTISEIVRKSQVGTLYMWYCHFNTDQLERFKALIADTGVEFLH